MSKPLEILLNIAGQWTGDKSKVTKAELAELILRLVTAEQNHE